MPENRRVRGSGISVCYTPGQERGYITRRRNDLGCPETIGLHTRAWR
ncbi:MAG: hypothetical protein GX216_10820 [Methanomicrobiales archaeon]|nr:hypothetical protein [Methanomicrobiales archaeon]